MSDLNNTPKSNRLHIGLFGRRNAGKSSLINALANQEVAIVSEVAGTTTDPVNKSIEIAGIGACVIVDTAGFDDTQTDLGKLRIERTHGTIQKTDIALLVIDASNKSNGFELEMKWAKMIEQADIPIIIVLNKIDMISQPQITALQKKLGDFFHADIVCVSGKHKQNIDTLIQSVIKNLPSDDSISITGHLIEENDTVLLVMPQDIQAPKGRLILPQVQTIRDLLDHKAIVISCTFDKMEGALSALSKPPKLIITDSQVFKDVSEKKHPSTILTSFSVLFARYKGDEKTYREGALWIDNLTEQSRILIAESCSHIPLEGDIGRVKIPTLLRKRLGENLSVEVVSGTDFPHDLSPYDLVIQCGGCMATRKAIQSRIKECISQGVHISNYGMVIAHLTETNYTT
ncbi:MAG: [FeFe] hydrogenase H-cluster maturation GTPase HydF [Treponemataceae bacterium]